MDGHAREDFASFYAQHAAFMRRALARRGVRAADLDDVAQEAFIVAHRRLPAFEGRSSLRTWLTAIAWRTASSYHRRAHDRPFEPEETEALTADPDAVSSFEHEDLPGACEALEPELRDLILLHTVGGLTISELSSLTGRARATVRQRLEQGRTLIARRRLRKSNTSSPPLDEAAASSHSVPFMQVLPNKPVCFSSIDDVLIHVRGGTTLTEDLRLGGDTMEAMLQAYPEGFRYLAVIEASSTVPTLEGRHVNAELARRFGSKFRAVSVAVESSTLMRLVGPIFNAYFVLARASINIRIFNGVGPATQWIAREPSDRAALLAHVAAMRARIAHQAGAMEPAR